MTKKDIKDITATADTTETTVTDAPVADQTVATETPDTTATAVDQTAPVADDQAATAETTATGDDQAATADDSRATDEQADAADTPATADSQATDDSQATADSQTVDDQAATAGTPSTTLDADTLSTVVERLRTREDIMDVSYGDHGEMRVTPTANFDHFLGMLPALNQETTRILDASLDDNDEDAIKATNAKLTDAKQAEKAIKAARKYIKDTFKHNEALALGQFDDALANAGYADFTVAVDRIKQRRIDIIEHRKAVRWDSLATLFAAELANYPRIARMAPKLADFANFKQQHAKLVSGAASRKVTDADRQVVINTVAHYNDIIDRLISDVNQQILTKPSARAVLDAYSANPNDDDFVKLINYYVMNPLTTTAPSANPFQQALDAVYHTYLPSQPQLQHDYYSRDLAVGKAAHLEVVSALINSITDANGYLHSVTHGDKTLVYDLVAYVVSH